nr:HAD-IA family hydrolase [Lachnospiraceae bacterium]
MREKRYDIILWDVDGTLLDFHRSERWALENAFLSYGMTIDDDIYRAFYKINLNYWKRLERQEVTRAQLLIGRFADLFLLFQPGGVLTGKGIPYETLSQINVDEFRLCYQKFLGSVYFYMDDSQKLCGKLKEDGFLQYIVSNGLEQVQKNKLHLAGFDILMEKIFVSEAVGYDKPDLRFFEHCMEEISQSMGCAKLDKSRILIVGDSMTSDMKGAENAGIDCCLYAPGVPLSEKSESVT